MDEAPLDDDADYEATPKPLAKRPRGRPKGSGTKKKSGGSRAVSSRARGDTALPVAKVFLAASGAAAAEEEEEVVKEEGMVASAMPLSGTLNESDESADTEEDHATLPPPSKRMQSVYGKAAAAHSAVPGAAGAAVAAPVAQPEKAAKAQEAEKVHRAAKSQEGKKRKQPDQRQAAAPVAPSPAAAAPAPDPFEGYDVLYGCAKCRYLRNGCSNCRGRPAFLRPKLRWRPEEGRPQSGVADAPTFRPTAEEFADPIAYISRITPLAEPHGLAHIVPPPGWQPPFALERGTNGLSMESFRFTIRKQLTSSLCRRVAPGGRTGAPPSKAAAAGGTGRYGGRPRNEGAGTVALSPTSGTAAAPADDAEGVKDTVEPEVEGEEEVVEPPIEFGFVTMVSNSRSQAHRPPRPPRTVTCPSYLCVPGVGVCWFPRVLCGSMHALCVF
jgi:hypothetical protein